MSAKLISAMEKKTCSRFKKLDGTVMLILYQDLTKDISFSYMFSLVSHKTETYNVGKM